MDGPSFVATFDCCFWLVVAYRDRLQWVDFSLLRLAAFGR